ncbi:hypothetical protein ACIQVC_42500 [Streptomyces sp. NPDC101112]
MDARTLCLLGIVALVGFVAFLHPAIGAAAVVAVTVGGFLYVVLKDDEG